MLQRLQLRTDLSSKNGNYGILVAPELIFKRLNIKLKKLASWLVLVVVLMSCISNLFQSAGIVLEKSNKMFATRSMRRKRNGGDQKFRCDTLTWELIADICFLKVSINTIQLQK